MYSKEFIDLVNFSYSESEKFYRENDKKTTPNPFYIGFGNPNAEIVIFGKEKAFNTVTEIEFAQLKYENINNPKEWKSNIDNEISFNDNQDKIEDKPYNYINSFYPYKGNQKGGHTWSKYQKLMRNIYPDKQFDKCDFFKDCFISEINHVPSKLSAINSYSNKSRLDLLKHDFYKKKVIILACGDYLHEDDIENLFDVKYSDKDSSSESNRKFEVFKNQKRILINTRQLSFNVRNEYLMKIAKIAKEYL